MSGIHDRDEMMRRLKQAWRRRRRFVSVRGFFYILLWAVVLGLVDFVIDWLTYPTAARRMGILAANIIILGVVGYREWWRNLHPYDPVVTALEVERLYPKLISLLVSYVHFHNRDAVRLNASPVLVDAMLRQAQDQTRSIHFGKIVSFRSIWRLYLYGFIACGLVAAAVMMHPGFVRVFVSRMFNPNSQMRYPTRTIILETSGNLVVQYGRAVVLRAVVSGELPEDATIRFEPEGESADTIRVRPDGSTEGGKRKFSYWVEEAYRDFVYSFSAGDAVSSSYRVRVVRSPHADIQVSVTYPEYTGLKRQNVQMLSFEAPAGSKIDWKVVSDRALSEARMILEAGQQVPVTLAADKKTGTVLLVPTNSFTYGFQWTDGEHNFVYAPEVRYSVRIMPDRPPSISLKSAVMDEKATAWKVVNTSFTARDDYGLGTAWLVYTVFHGDGDAKGDPEKREQVQVFRDGQLEATENLKWQVQNSIKGLKPGDRVKYAIEVTDKQPAPAGPGVTRSEACLLTIVSQEEYLKMAIERRRRLLGRIKTLQGEEVDAEQTIRTILKESGNDKNENKKK